MASRVWTAPSAVGTFLFHATALLSTAVSEPVHQGKPAPPDTGTVLITAALVDLEMQVRPVPLLSLILATAAGDTFSTRTGVDGRATVAVPVGEYIVCTITPALFQNRRYSWKVPAKVSPAALLEVALTNDNATAEEVGSPGPPLSHERMDVAAALFERLSGSVFKLQAGLAHGTAFLADTLGGVLLTNAHVVEAAEASNLSVVLDRETRVRAQLLARDSEADIAVLRVHPDFTSGRDRIALQDPAGKTPVVPGERVVAMGYPLSQELTITTGIASSVRSGAVITDININPGNSGGPLLNIDGEVVAVNTFGEMAAAGGAGVYGAILIARAGPALDQAAAELRQAVPPPPDRLPTMPDERLNIATLKAFVDAADLDLYRDFSKLDIAGFDVTLQTPAATLAAIKLYENEIAKDRKKREERAELPESERYSEVREIREWSEYVGARTTPVVGISIIPRVGGTGGFSRETHEFEGDLRAAQVFRNEQLVEPIRGGHAPVRLYIENQWVSFKDVADLGFYVFDPEIFRPDSTGVPPSIVLALNDLKSPGRMKCREFPSKVVAQAWNEFESFYRERRPDADFRRAATERAKDRKSARRSDFLDEECEWWSGSAGSGSGVGY